MGGKGERKAGKRNGERVGKVREAGKRDGPCRWGR